MKEKKKTPFANYLFIYLFFLFALQLFLADPLALHFKDEL
jgi:hypothetical protein